MTLDDERKEKEKVETSTEKLHHYLYEKEMGTRSDRQVDEPFTLLPFSPPCFPIIQLE